MGDANGGGQGGSCALIGLQLSPGERAALREYLAFYRTHGSMIAAPSAFPFIDADVCATLEADEWELYVSSVREHATKGASAGLSYVDWFEIAVRHRRAALAALSEQSEAVPNAATTLARGLDRLIEMAVHTVGETYRALRLQHASTPGADEFAASGVPSLAIPSPARDSASPITTTSRLLLVEDDEDLLRTLGRGLRRSGYDVVETGGGRQAIAELEGATFDVIVSDIHMPDGGGLDLLRVVRRVDLDVPVILISGIADVQSAAAAVAYGAFRYLPKPLNFDVLETTIRHALHAHALARLRRRAVSSTGRHAGAADRAGLEVRFEQALSGLWIAFQPIVYAGSGLLFGVEALLRSNEPSLPSPVDIVDAATQLGRTAELGRRVRELAAAGLSGRPELQLFVNLHPEDFSDADLVAETAQLSQIASRVILEVTERSVLRASTELSACISSLRALGFRLAVDDIGAGYSGLTSFADLTPEIVKIDMALVRNIHLSSHRQKTVKALCNLCHEVDCLIIGEGVETDEERACLIGLDCDLLQGYLLGRPQPVLPATTNP
jgi:EAL domain-containing protein (putative c-di-GMP-specific phosphodiesterase class I)